MPSSIFNSACCTPSPDTSRVIDTFVDIDYAALSQFNIVIRVLDKAQQYVFHILAHVTGLGQAGCVADCERHVEHLRQRLRQISFTAAGRADHQYVGLLQLNIVFAAGILYPLIMIVYGNCQRLFCCFLTHHVLIQYRLQFGGLGQRSAFHMIVGTGILGHYLLTEAYALVADIHARSGYYSAHLILRFAAERAFNELADPLIAFCHFSPHIGIYPF